VAVESSECHPAPVVKAPPPSGRSVSLRGPCGGGWRAGRHGGVASVCVNLNRSAQPGAGRCARG
jgi:hypothetical protein